MSNPDPRFDMPGILRALRAEARQKERTRVLDTLRLAASQDDLRARESRSPRPTLTGYGRRAVAMRQAVELLERAGKTQYAGEMAGESYAQVYGACDSIELYEYDPADEEEPEPMPVRVAVIDGADDALASAYLTLDEAEQIFTDGLALVELIRRRRAERQSVEAPEQAQEDTRG